MSVTRLIAGAVLTCLLLAGCGGAFQTLNSFANDEARFGSYDGSPFGQAKQIIATQCLSCHPNFSDYTTEADWEDAGYMVPGDADSSPVYYRLRGSTGAQGPKTMPLSGALSAEEVTVIRDWIDAL